MVRNGREPKIQDLFSQMRLFFPLLLFAIALFIAITLGYMLLVIPGIVLIALICFGCLYMLPLMTDRKLGLVSAFKESWRLSMEGRVIDQIAVVLLFLGITFVGSSLFIASLFTQPLATAILVSVYEEKISVSGENSG
jgi:membrane-anchored glycerophosphoryl diester phosphodiesterase (GDPDase)